MSKIGTQIVGMFGSILLLVLCCLPIAAHAHEVYVLNQTEVGHALSEGPLDFSPIFETNRITILVAGVLAILLVVGIFFLSVAKGIERFFDPFLFKIKPFASYIAQFTLGLALLASAYYGALFGPELPLKELFGEASTGVRALLLLSGLSLILGIYPRVAGFLGVAVFFFPLLSRGFYMLNYGTYFGEALVVLALGSSYALYEFHQTQRWKIIDAAFAKYKFLVLRIFFGSSLIYASLYAKYIYGSLALETVTKYNLVQFFFNFDPLLIVFGALLIELMIGIFVIVGFELRSTSLFFLGFLIVSLVFFQEALWPHVMLIGTALAMAIHGYDRFTIESRLIKNKEAEPVF